jgi:hypothetical protein
MEIAMMTEKMTETDFMMTCGAIWGLMINPKAETA